MRALVAALFVTVVLASGCAGGGSEPRSATTLSTSPTTVAPPTSLTTTAPTTTTTTQPAPTTTAGPTQYVGTIAAVTEERLGLSWRPGCPVGADDLRLLTIAHHTFDGRTALGELIVHASIAERTVEAFGDLWAMGFPINKMVTADAFIRPEDIDPNGGYISEPGPDLVNDTAAFMCRAITGGRGWSEHALGTAIDINPVQNPYLKGATLVPTNGLIERDAAVAGALLANSAAVEAFTSRGFTWGGSWRSLKDFMHFSIGGR